MATNLENYADIQAMVQKDARDIATEVYREMATKYGVADVPLHRHNGADSPLLDGTSLIPFVTLPSTTGGVVATDVLGSQVVNETRQASNPQLAGTKNSPAILVNCLPVIYGQGRGLFNVTVNPVIGNTSRTLTSAYPYATAVRLTTFESLEQRYVTYTNGSTAISWTGALTIDCTTNDLFVDGSPSSFAGGDAPIGTALIFTNPAGGGLVADGTTLWVRVNSVPNFTSGTFTLTAGITAGDTSATLTAAWTLTSGIYYTVFSNQENRNVSFTQDSTSITWSGGLTTNASTTITVSAVGWYGIEFSQLIPI